MSKQSGVGLTRVVGGVLLCVCGPALNRAVAQEPAQEAVVLEEIVVNAQRRTENSQQVPVAVTVASAETLQNLGVAGSQDLGVVAPAVTFSPTVGGSRITIRGVGSTGSLGDESANAVYVDGVYFPSLPSLLLSFSNIERLEVLKGPQGTLFGRNASGGVVQVVTKKPSSNTQADVMLGYGSYETMEGSLYATGGIVSNLAADIAVYVQDQNEGWGRYLTTGGEAYSGKARTARTSWLWTPGDSTSLRFSALYSKTDAPSNNGGQIVPGETIAPGGTVGNAGFYNSTANVRADYSVEQRNYSLNLNQDLDWATLVNIASRDEVTATQVLDNNYSPGGLSTHFGRFSHTWTDELQLQSPERSRIRWIGGAFYFSNEQALNPGLTSTPTGALARNVLDVMDTKSWAVFGQATAPLVGATSLTLGARYTHDNHEIQGSLASAAGVLAIPSKSQADSKATYRVALNQQFTDDLMGYVSYSTGFKSGFYSMTSPTDPAVRPQSVDAYELGVKSELLDRRVRLNAAVFYDKFKDIQVRVVNGTTASISFLNAAAGEIKGLDLDVEAAVTQNLTLTAALTYLDTQYTDFPNSLVYQVNAAGVLVRGPSASATGNDLINAPPFVGTLGADYTVPMTWGDLVLNATYNYNDGYFFDSQNRIAQPAYQLVNASVSYLTPSKHWRVRLYGNNLANKKYFANVDITDGTGDIYWAAPPRIYGLQVSWSL